MAIAGFFTTFVLDRIWFSIDYKKAEKGLEVHEHYHVALELHLVSIVMWIIHVDILAVFLIGAGVGFFLLEAFQDNAFACTSKHFRASTYVGVGLAILVMIAVYAGSILA